MCNEMKSFNIRNLSIAIRVHLSDENKLELQMIRNYLKKRKYYTDFLSFEIMQIVQ